MKEMYTTLKAYAKEKPKDFTMSMILLGAVFLLFTFAIVIAA